MGVPVYLVLTDAALREIAERRPLTHDDLSRIHGVGPRTLAKFGPTLLRITDTNGFTFACPADTSMES
jgi:ATP-dependent DNA helicase RecQ